MRRAHFVKEKVKENEGCVAKTECILRQQLAAESADITKDIYRKMDEASEEPVEE